MKNYIATVVNIVEIYVGSLVPALSYVWLDIIVFYLNCYFPFGFQFLL